VKQNTLPSLLSQLTPLQASTTFLYDPNRFLKPIDNTIDLLTVEQGGIKLPENCQDGKSTQGFCVSSTPNPLKPT
jgi:hypothetical protein